MNSKGDSYLLSRLAIGLIWLYHGLVPKLIFRSATELELIQHGPVVGSAETTLLLAGIGEVVLGLCVFVSGNRLGRRWFLSHERFQC